MSIDEVEIGRGGGLRSCAAEADGRSRRRFANAEGGVLVLVGLERGRWELLPLIVGSVAIPPEPLDGCLESEEEN